MSALRNSIPQNGLQGQTHTKQFRKFVVPDGVHYNETIGEYEIWIGGECVGYDSMSYTSAHRRYTEELRRQREHVERNPANRTTIFETFAKLVDGGQMPAPNQVETIWQSGVKQVKIWRRQDDNVVLILKRGKYSQVISDPLAFYGRDDNHISSAQAGKWKLALDAERKYQDWATRAKAAA